VSEQTNTALAQICRAYQREVERLCHVYLQVRGEVAERLKAAVC
jgi:hypothetical protein